MGRSRVVIIGGGFGGLYTARALGRTPVDVTLIDRRNFHLFQPLLYQVATGALSPANIAAPLRAVLRRQKNSRVILGEVRNVQVATRQVILADGQLEYDTLVVAAGSWHHYFGHPEWEALAPGLKTVEDATDVRRRVLLAFEAAERETDAAERQRWLTFVLVGGGPTGVELAGALGELSRYTLRQNFRSIDPADARVILLEGTDRILPSYPPELSARAVKLLKSFGVSVRTGSLVTDVRPEAVVVRMGDCSEQIPTRTVLWAAGVQASPLGAILARAAGIETDRPGRVPVTANLSLPGHPEVFVIGDLALIRDANGNPLPGVAPVAIQEGQYVARLIDRRLRGEDMPAFRYRDRGNVATIGRSAAVADLGWVRFGGRFAWFVWVFVHIIYLIEFENRLLVLTQWAWNYITRNRSARLITGQDPLLRALPTRLSVALATETTKHGPGSEREGRGDLPS